MTIQHILLLLSGSAFSQTISWLSAECTLLVKYAKLSAVLEHQNIPHCLLMIPDVSHSSIPTYILTVSTKKGHCDGGRNDSFG